MINVAIVGLGKVGKIRKSILEKKNGVQIIGYLDPDVNCKDESLQQFADLGELLSSQVDAVFICGYANVSAPYTKAALQAGIHVFCEKPPALSYDELLNLKKIVKESKCILKYGFNHRYHGSVAYTKDLLDTGSLGEILFMRGVYGKAGSIDFDKNWRNTRKFAGGGILMDQGVHMIDLVAYLSNQTVECEYAMIETRYWNIDFEDNAFLMLRGCRGFIASVHSSATQWDHRFSLELYCERGAINLSGLVTPSMSYAPEQVSVAYNQDNSPKFTRANSFANTISFDADHSWEIEIDEFLSAITGAGQVLNGTFEQALSLMRIVSSAYSFR